MWLKHEDVCHPGEGGVVGHDPREAHLLGPPIEAEVERVLDRPLHHRPRDPLRPVGLLGQEAVNQLDVELGRISGDQVIAATPHERRTLCGARAAFNVPQVRLVASDAVAGLSLAHWTIRWDSRTTSPSSVTSTGTQLWPVSSLTGRRVGFMKSGSAAQP